VLSAQAGSTKNGRKRHDHTTNPLIKTEEDHAARPWD